MLREEVGDVKREIDVMKSDMVKVKVKDRSDFEKAIFLGYEKIE